MLRSVSKHEEHIPLFLFHGALFKFSVLKFISHIMKLKNYKLVSWVVPFSLDPFDPHCVLFISSSSFARLVDGLTCFI